VVSEVADLIFHVSVLLTDIDIDWDEIGQELGRRAK
jgi:phosphoribosyl-ATP pyrophosphohydrolase